MNIRYLNYALRPATREDAPLLASWWNDGEVMAHTGNPLGLGVNIKDAELQLEKDKYEKYHRLMMEYNGKPIGECYYRELDEATARIGIRICDFTLHNKGMGRIILSMLISQLFEVLGYHYVIVITNTNNHRAQHVYKTLGFEEVGIEHNSEKDQLGNLQSMVVYKMKFENFISFLK